MVILNYAGKEILRHKKWCHNQNLNMKQLSKRVAHKAMTFKVIVHQLMFKEHDPMCLTR